jgi:tRNA (guanine-N7-)-methyltransferase
LIHNKLTKYADIKQFTNVLECGFVKSPPLELSGSWADIPFHGDAPLVLELGCGRGEYSIAMAERSAEKNFIGIDIKGARLWFGAKAALEEGLGNVFFVRMQIEHINALFPRASVDEIWIPFPDPHTNHPSRDTKRRLTSPVFLNRYREVLKAGGIVHLKTDHRVFYEYSLETITRGGGNIISHTDDLYNSERAGDTAGIKTAFEKRYTGRGIAIKYIEFSL